MLLFSDVFGVVWQLQPTNVPAPAMLALKQAIGHFCVL